MRIDKLYIEKFKNLINFKIDFDENELTTVLIGHNGTGKSNLMEAIVIIFKNLDLGKQPDFNYNLIYYHKDKLIQIIHEQKKESNQTIITVDGSKISLSKFVNEKQYLPKYVFAYYSGPTNRLEVIFDDHQKRFYDKLIKGKEIPLRPLFYSRQIHSHFVLLAFFSYEDKIARKFLEKYFGILDLESVTFILKKPSWKSKEGDRRFWNARGVVSEFLGDLYELSSPPVKENRSIRENFRKSSKKEILYLHLSDLTKLQALAVKYENNRNFFKMLESTYISELLEEVDIKIKMKGLENSISFSELSEGEQQLIMVFGLLKFTKDDESLFLLDEPDTHLNPAWKYEYMNLLEEVVKKPKTSHIIMSTHDPLIIGGLEKSQVQIFEKKEDGGVTARISDIDPRGMGVAGLLTSELFGLRSSLDSETQKLLDKRNNLMIKASKDKLNAEEQKDMRELSEKLEEMGFTKTIRDPLYQKFVIAMSSHKQFQKPVLTSEERKEQDKIALKIIEKILKEEKNEVCKN